MSYSSLIRDNWRIVLLAILLVLSAFTLFGPQDQTSANNESTLSLNLNYGIQLSGGTRIRAPIAGLTAENVTVGNRSDEIEETVSSELNLPRDRVNAFFRTQDRPGHVEVLNGSITEEEFARALQEADLTVSTDDIREGVSPETRQRQLEIIRDKVSAAGLSGGSARVSRTAAGKVFIVVEAPGRGAQELRELLASRGNVSVVAYHVQNGSYRNQTVLTGSDLTDIGAAQQGQQTGPHVPVRVKDTVAERFANEMVALGFGDGSSCRFEDYGNATGECLLIIQDGRVLNSFSVTAGLGQSFRNGDFVQDPSFIMQTTNITEAQRLSINLQAGELPAPLAFEEGTTYSLEPALAQRFKINSAITGLIAIFAVSGVVFLRYGRPKVALPMILTALAEVFLLLGFAAAIDFPLDLAVIAGFIAVIGTGVDDLIIIADEILTQGHVRSDRVFRDRFRKAFWVIAAAAATTIIAMSPLAVLSLGDLQGFAIITILGVLIGVIVTRPAYGDILRYLLDVT